MLIHHSGKAGTQRGTSKREDILDTVITLKRPKDYVSNEGARFIVEYEKARGFCGDEAKPFEAKLFAEENKKPCWIIRSVEEGTCEKVVMMTNEGISQADIAEELGVNKSTVSRHVKAAREAGLIKSHRG